MVHAACRLPTGCDVVTTWFTGLGLGFGLRLGLGAYIGSSQTIHSYVRMYVEKYARVRRRM